MIEKNKSKKIIDAIKCGQQIKIEYKSGLSSFYIEQYINPYIFGSDIFQYDFVWAYIPYVNNFYKFYLDNIKSIIVTDLSFTFLPEAIYQYSMEEEHYSVVFGFNNIYFQQALQAKNEGENPKPSNS